ncbi:hypothetical protein GPECTOR_30g282 [Gonium pectorale]|uniref:Uncharacterized protein n=1 Tax=Gonium pectorale TaxID=33097 RepID=A0A150GEC7_GONPE|nr:hypothetical protein GPECTOR_30g282 [Gonium pectorale]|eukprot:KXZ48186.1 hypothetical protein GPECTOR_30g282 [Gonium pectorale]
MERMRNWIQRRLDYSTSIAAGLKADIAEERKKLRELAGAEKEAKKRKRDGTDDFRSPPAASAAAGKRIKLSGAAAAAAAAHMAAHADEGEGGEEDEEEEEPSWELPDELLAYEGDPTDRRAVANFRARQTAAKQRLQRARARWHSEARQRSKERDARRRHLEPPDQRVARERREAEEALLK